MPTLKKLIPALIAVLALLASCEKQKIAVTSVSVSPDKAELVAGRTTQVTATVQPANATEKTIQWSSSNPSVATVSDNGLVTAIAGGSATITAKAGDKQASCTVTVTVPVASVTLDKTELTLIQGNSEMLAATVSPSDATDKTIFWESSDTSVATVDQNGNITAVKAGKSIITAKAGGLSATCTVTVAPSNIPGGHEDTGRESWD